MSELVTVSEVSTETATAADAVASDAQTQANRMEPVSGSVESLSTEARQLGGLLATFQTGDGTMNDEPTKADAGSRPRTARRHGRSRVAVRLPRMVARTRSVAYEQEPPTQPRDSIQTHVDS